MVVGVLHLTNQIEIASGGSYADRIVRQAPPPWPGRELPSPLRINAFQLHQGDTV